ncbi:cytoplasmic protein [Salmonella enterica]|nr:cytoplasmic protein [Salmonella enterica]
MLTRTARLKAGYSHATIAAMTPVAERQNRHRGDWYPLSSAS